MKPDKHDLEQKEIRRLRKRDRELWDAIRDQPYVELKEPFQRGWEVYYKLRDDISRRRDAEKIQDLLQLAFQECRVVRSVQHIKNVRKGEKGYYATDWDGRRRYVSYGPDPIHIDQKQYDQLEDHLKVWYHPENRREYAHYSQRYRIILPEYWLVMKVRPHIVTHMQVIDGELYSESNCITRRLERIAYSRYRYCQYQAGQERMLLRLAIQKFIHGEAEDIAILKAFKQ
ncbi:MAG: hypothetical protein JSS76_13375 [Bacteroidetes bacterium]|nr:hypothetical protein [Bacteroidota bacterium]MBS1685746.1 hypothetical protein [Bacteroidota bacterium]